MNVVERAILFATEAHKGQVRKIRGTPYILHPMEVAAIIATMTTDPETMAAGVLHDTVEDCGVDPREIKERFGARVAALVQSESEDKLADRPPEETWQQRKEESLLMLQHTKDREVKILWLADKLANLRSFYREYLREGDALWQRFHQKDPAMQAWYYRTVAAYVPELSDTAAYAEYIQLTHLVFGKGEET